MDNFYTSSYFFLSFLRFIGLFPKSFDGPVRNGWLKTFPSDFIFSLFWFLSQLFTTFFIFHTNSHKFTGNSKILPKAWSCVTILELLLFSFLFCYQISQQRNIVKFVTKIHKIDEKVKLLFFKLKSVSN